MKRDYRINEVINEIIFALDMDIVYLSDRGDRSSIDYEFQNLSLTVGHLKWMRSILERIKEVFLQEDKKENLQS